jgi:regulator of protease activity HflC (stomatin/prohibitin superfamily)
MKRAVRTVRAAPQWCRTRAVRDRHGRERRIVVMRYGRIHIREHERGLRLRGGDFVGLLRPGRHLVLRPGDAVEVADTLRGRFEHPRLEVLVRHAALADELVLVDLADRERAVVRRDGRVTWVLGPGRHAFWREPARIDVERFDADALRFEHPSLDAVLAADGARAWLDEVAVPEDHELLVHRDGRLAHRVAGGRFVHWRRTGRVTARAVDLREQVLDVAGQEILTQDKVTLRVNLVVAYRVADPVVAVESVSDAGQALYREAQLALRAAVGTRTLDALLADKESAGGEVRNAVSARARAFGVEVRSVGLRDLILPGDMKQILNQVVTAQKEAEANLIRRREETAAARSQANTARLLAENPVLVRLRELETLERVLSGSRATIVFGQGDLATQVRALAAEPQAPA